MDAREIVLQRLPDELRPKEQASGVQGGNYAVWKAGKLSHLIAQDERTALMFKCGSG